MKWFAAFCTLGLLFAISAPGTALSGEHCDKKELKTMADQTDFDPMANAMSMSRPPPADIRPVELDGIRFEQARTGLPPTATDTSGWLLATDTKTGAQLWLKQIYTAPPTEEGDPMAASAPSTVYMKRLSVEGQKILILDELGRQFHVDPKSGESTPLE
jgi:hypothetical protein